MTRLVAALDGSPATQPVLAMATAAAGVLGTTVRAVHIREDGGERTARALAAAAGVDLEVVRGPVVETLDALTARDDVVALAIGARRTTATPEPGKAAFQLGAALRVPLFVVPPDAPRPGQLERVLVPLQGATPTSFTPRLFLPLAEDAQLDVIALQVHDEDTIPAFTDQPQHERAAWAHEFLARYSPVDPAHVRLEVRVGERPEVVVAVAGELDPDLVALAWNPETVPGCGSIVRALLRRSPIPLLLLPVVAGSGNGGAPAATLRQELR